MISSPLRLLLNNGHKNSRHNDAVKQRDQTMCSRRSRGPELSHRHQFSTLGKYIGVRLRHSSDRLLMGFS